MRVKQMFDKKTLRRWFRFDWSHPGSPTPHQGKKECARRRKQLAEGKIYNSWPKEKIIRIIFGDEDAK